MLLNRKTKKKVLPVYVKLVISFSLEQLGIFGQVVVKDALILGRGESAQTEVDDRGLDLFGLYLENGVFVQRI